MLLRDQARTLFVIVDFANRTGRVPAPAELASLLGIPDEAAARARVSRLRRNGYLVGKGKDTAVNRKEVVTEPGTARALLRIADESGRSPTRSLAKQDVVAIIEAAAGQPGTGEVLLGRLERSGYLDEVNPGATTFRSGQKLGHDREYLEMLSKPIITNEVPPT